VSNTNLTGIKKTRGLIAYLLKHTTSHSALVINPAHNINTRAEIMQMHYVCRYDLCSKMAADLCCGIPLCDKDLMTSYHNKHLVKYNRKYLQYNFDKYIYPFKKNK